MGQTAYLTGWEVFYLEENTENHITDIMQYFVTTGHVFKHK